MVPLSPFRRSLSTTSNTPRCDSLCSALKALVLKAFSVTVRGVPGLFWLLEETSVAAVEADVDVPGRGELLERVDVFNLRVAEGRGVDE
jgi:hypothetical protein